MSVHNLTTTQEEREYCENSGVDGKGTTTNRHLTKCCWGRYGKEGGERFVADINGPRVAPLETFVFSVAEIYPVQIRVFQTRLS